MSERMPLGVSVKHEQQAVKPSIGQVAGDIRRFLGKEGHPRRREAFEDVVEFERLVAAEQKERARSSFGRVIELPELTKKRSLIEEKAGSDTEYAADKAESARLAEELGLAMERQYRQFGIEEFGCYPVGVMMGIRPIRSEPPPRGVVELRERLVGKLESMLQ